MQKTKMYILFCFLMLLIAVGACCFIYQSAKGLVTTGLGEPVVWGAYVVNFTFCLGLAAGILIVLTIVIGADTSGATEVFVLSIAGLVSLAMAGAFIIIDLGRPGRFYYLIIYPQPKSPLFWDFIIVNFFMTVAIAYCFVTLRQIYLKVRLSNNVSLFERIIYKVVTVNKESNINKSVKKAIRVLMLVLIIGAYLVTTEVFTSLRAHPPLHGPVFSLVFLISALVSGISAFILIKSFCHQSCGSENNIIFNSEQKFICFLLTADMIMMLVEYYMDKNNPLIARVHSLFPFSLLILLIIGNVIPILLMLFCRPIKLSLYRLVPILILVGVLLKRAELIIPVYFGRWLPFAPEASYRPTFPEISIGLGVYSTAIMTLMVAFYFAKSISRKNSCNLDTSLV